MKTCTIGECRRPFYGRGMCNMHYQRFKRNGDPRIGKTHYTSPSEAFQARTEWRANCLIWTGSKTSAGYGHLRKDGRMVLAHRYAWESVNDPIPEGLCIDHICMTRLCCNVAHLRLATYKQNAEHMKLSVKNTSGYRGVCWDSRYKKWIASVTHNGELMVPGYFDTAEEAALAAKDLRIALYTHNDLDRLEEVS